MASLDISLFEGTNLIAPPEENVLKRIHLATRGTGNRSSLARALNECCRNRRYFTEGSILRVKLCETFDDLGQDATFDNVSAASYAASTEERTSSSSRSYGSYISSCNETNNSNNGRKNISRCISYSSEWSSDEEEEGAGHLIDESHTSPPEDGTMLSTLLNAAASFTRAFSISDDRNEYVNYVVVKCEPQSGYIDDDTIIHLDDSLPELERITLLWDAGDKNHFVRCMDYFLNHRYSYLMWLRNVLDEQRLSGPFRVNSQNSLTDSYCVKKTLFLEKLDKASLNVDDTTYLDLGSRLRRFYENVFVALLQNTLGSSTRVYHAGQFVTVRDLHFFVSDTRPNKCLGVITPSTDIYIGIDMVGVCKSISVAPLLDTLPSTYEYDLMKDYVKPYFHRYSAYTYAIGDSFRFHGVQFRVVDVVRKHDEFYTSFMDYHYTRSRQGKCSRVGKRSVITVLDPVRPQLTDILTGSQIRSMQRCAPKQRDLLMCRFLREMDDEALDRISHNDDNYLWNFTLGCLSTSDSTSMDRVESSAGPGVQQYNIVDMAGSPSSTSSDAVTCSVCWEAIDQSNSCSVFRYTCGHIFHKKCANAWTNRRKFSCPNCRQRDQRLIKTVGIDELGQWSSSDIEDNVWSDAYFPSRSLSIESLSGMSDLNAWFNSQES
ncbi:Ring finger domain family protein [Babesia bovis T2Bo]|uniref:RING-type domain-containing protein n=1 Tax=Babesia bovis TaxID=5865 RepID=A7AW81_BABBO|nr:Ring finger domain family protein [Babesia bovis T2Bo]EDO05309.1 Ring finger domain family protein [Babesia bovis T2Bo]|eukprot:XP_001608877.1 hypothetical protein [Babesia bovis T2Bo]